MKKKYILFIAAVILSSICLIYACKKTDKEDSSNTDDNEMLFDKASGISGYGVVNVDRLRFRSDSDLHSKTLRYLDRGAVVKITGRNDERVKIGEMTDFWYNIEYEGITGWAFGYFVDICGSHEKALAISKMYLAESFADDAVVNFHADQINKNLFFLSDGKILQLTDILKGSVKILNTLPGFTVSSYFFSRRPGVIYYIAKKPDDRSLNGSLFAYYMKSEKSRLISKEIYSADGGSSGSMIIALSLAEFKNEEYWTIKTINKDSPGQQKEVTKIKKKHESENLENDPFSKTLERELGNFARLSSDPIKNLIYFKPPEENLTYIISMSSGEYIQTEPEEKNIFVIDHSRSLSVRSGADEKGNEVYTIRFTEYSSLGEKEALASPLYPMSFSVSPDKDLVAISMIDLKTTDNGLHGSSIYVLPLSTLALIPVSVSGQCYQPRWAEPPVE